MDRRLREVLDDATRIRLRADARSRPLHAAAGWTRRSLLLRTASRERAATPSASGSRTRSTTRAPTRVPRQCVDAKLSRATVGSAEIAELLPRVVELQSVRSQDRAGAAPQLAVTVHESGPRSCSPARAPTSCSAATTSSARTRFAASATGPESSWTAGSLYAPERVPEDGSDEGRRIPRPLLRTGPDCNQRSALQPPHPVRRPACA